MGDRITQEQVKQWLDDANLAHEPFPVDDDHDFEWGLLVSGQTYSMVLAHRQTDYNHLFLQIGLGISDSHREALRVLPDYDRRLFVYDLKLALLRQPIGSSLELENGEGVSDDHTPVPIRIMLGYNLLEESITRAGFLRRNHQMQAAAHIASTMLQKLAHMGRWP